MAVWIDETACAVDSECRTIRVCRPYLNRVLITVTATDEKTHITVCLSPEEAEALFREARRVVRAFAKEIE